MSEFQDTNIVKTNTFNKGMNKDVTDIFMPEGVWTHARNLINNAHYGELGSVGNEQANKFCVEVPSRNPFFIIVGFAYMSDRRWVLFSTNNAIGEIGIYNENNESYTTVYNDSLAPIEHRLGFVYTHLISAVAKENYDCTWSVYWANGLNPDRVLNLDHAIEGNRRPYKKSSPFDPCSPSFENYIDVDELKLHPKIDQACTNVKRSDNDGQLINGSYMACIAYSEKGIRLTDYSIPSSPQPIWSPEGIGGSLQIEVSNLDNEFDEFHLIVIFSSNSQTVAKKIGNYSISRDTGNTETIVLDQMPDSLPTVPLADIPLKNVVYDRSDKMFSVNDYLIRTGVATHPFFNYQSLANEIDTKWVGVRYSENYYRNGGNKAGYLRDEVYAFFIRWVYDTGARSASFHIPGREATGTELSAATSNTVRAGERQFETIDTSTITASGQGTVIGGVDIEEGVVVASGNMGYWESTENYPSNPDIWGDLCGQPIRHHKIPSDTTMQLFEDGGKGIYVIGVKFENIQRPVDIEGNLIPNIVGYEILRGSREGNRSIVAKGMFNNLMKFKIPFTNDYALMQNYPYNQTTQDPFLTDNVSQITNPNNAESSGLNDYVQNMFSFHSPDTTFKRPYLGANYVHIYNTITGTAKGDFEIPYQHPKFKLLRDSSFYTAAVLGLGIGLLAGMGKSTVSSNTVIGTPFANQNYTSASDPGLSSALPYTVANMTIETAQGLTFNPGGVASTFAKASSIVLFLGNVTFFSSLGIDEILRTIRGFAKYRDHVVQFNSVGFYNQYGKDVDTRSAVPSAGLKYIGSGVQNFTDTLAINNLNRNKYVGVHTIKSYSLIAGGDNSKKRITGGSLDKSVKSNLASYYGAIKLNYRNQYGQLPSIIQIPVSPCVMTEESTPVLFGGDIYINRYTEKNPFYFFNNWLQDVPDGTEFNYRNHINGPIPMYWIDSNVYDTTDIDLNLSNIFSGGGAGDPTSIDGTSPTLQTPRDFYSLDGNNKGIFVVKEGWMYLTYNGVRDFFVESEINLAYREGLSENIEQAFYQEEGGFNNLNLMFRSDKITLPIYYKYNWSMSASKLFNNFASWGNLLRSDYRDDVYQNCFEYMSRRVIYSLQQQQGMRRDNWRNYLPMNYKDFNSIVSSIKELNKTGAIILFEDNEPLSFQGIDRIQTESGQKFTIGDGGLFQQDENSMVNADNSLQHAHCISTRSAINTPFGMFFISQDSGSIFQYSGEGFQDITRNGMKYWFKENLPSKFLAVYPDYPLYDNPVAGIGCQAVYDPDYELVYFTKRDLIPLNHSLLFEDSTGRPYVMNEKGKSYVDYKSDCFIDCSWTVSYDPKTQAWLSFHDWKPSLVMQSSKHFLTIDPISKNTIWRHNERVDAYHRYYGKDYGWEIEYPISTPNNVTTLRNLEYNLEVYKFNNNKDAYHVLNDNFDEAVIYNSEQSSGLLELQLEDRKNPFANLQYPQILSDRIKALYSKEENKYRINQFWDITKDRNEDEVMWNTEENGYIKALNPDYLDYNKARLQRKKFRHYGNKILLKTKPVFYDKKMVLKLINNKMLNSSR